MNPTAVTQTPSFERSLAVAWPPADWRDLTVVAAVSGGADSVALLRGLAALKTAGSGRLIVAHFNHRLRPEANDEARFVGQLAGQLGLVCELGEADTAATARASGDGIEAAARAERYRFLQCKAEQLGARYVVTAHTADDQAETILHRLLRGTGIAGLSGMRRARPLGEAVTLLRPLLGIRRAEIIAYLDQLRQPHCEDASNASLLYTRNRIRHSLLPLLATDYNADAIGALLRLGETARSAQRVIEGLAEDLLQRAASFDSPRRILIDCRELTGADRHITREMFVAIWRRQRWPEQAMGFAEWDELAEMAIGECATASRTLPGPMQAERDGPRLVLTRAT